MESSSVAISRVGRIFGRMGDLRSRRSASAGSGQCGFTLIELLTVIALIGILSALGIQGFTVYKSSAAYATSQALLRHSRVAVAQAKSDPDNLPAAVSGSQTTPGILPAGAARQLLTGISVPKNAGLYYEYDPTCAAQTDLETRLSARHCTAGEKFARWEQYCDGVEIELEVVGAGCP